MQQAAREQGEESKSRAKKTTEKRRKRGKKEDRKKGKEEKGKGSSKGKSSKESEKMAKVQNILNKPKDNTEFSRLVDC